MEGALDVSVAGVRHQCHHSVCFLRTSFLRRRGLSSESAAVISGVRLFEILLSHRLARVWLAPLFSSFCACLLGASVAAVSPSYFHQAVARKTFVPPGVITAEQNRQSHIELKWSSEDDKISKALLLSLYGKWPIASRLVHQDELLFTVPRA